MTEFKASYKEILSQEDEVLSSVISLQSELRFAVKNKDWAELMKVISDINLSMDKFNNLDAQREAAVVYAKTDEIETKTLLAEVRGKLVRVRAENKALSEYINITRNFVRGIIDSALPQSRAKVYGRSGKILQTQPDSVVVNTLF